MISRTVSILLCLSILFGGWLGLSNGTILYVDEDGHLAVELPHVPHAHLHSGGTDHAAHDCSVEADHDDLHHHLSAAQHITTGSRKFERRGTAALADGDDPRADQTSVAFVSALALEPALVTVRRQSGQSPGLAARTERASLRAIILIV